MQSHNMEGRPLDHLELLTIARKDAEYCKDLVEDNLQELAQRLLGVRRWIRFRDALIVLSRFGYFALTTLSQRRTPGEEFCEAKPCSNSMGRNLLMVLLNNELPKVPYLNFLTQVHHITFLLFGDFCEFSKRLTNFSYLTEEYQARRSTRLYNLIGCASLIKLFLNLVKQNESNRLTIKDQVSSNTIIGKQIGSKDNICYLCSEARQEATSTLCGHIFCWNCIHNWLKQRSECPICRSSTEPSRLIHLVNFR